MKLLAYSIRLHPNRSTAVSMFLSVKTRMVMVRALQAPVEIRSALYGLMESKI